MSAAVSPPPASRIASVAFASLVVLTVCALLCPPRPAGARATAPGHRDAPAADRDDLERGASECHDPGRADRWLRSVRTEQEQARAASQTAAELAAALAAIRARRGAELVEAFGAAAAATIAARAPLIGVAAGRVVAVDLDGEPLRGLTTAGRGPQPDR